MLVPIDPWLFLSPWFMALFQPSRFVSLGVLRCRRASMILAAFFPVLLLGIGTLSAFMAVLCVSKRNCS